MQPLHIQQCHIQNLDTFRDEVSSKAFGTCKMMRHSQNSFLKHCQGYRDIKGY